MDLNEPQASQADTCSRTASHLIQEGRLVLPQPSSQTRHKAFFGDRLEHVGRSDTQMPHEAQGTQRLPLHFQ